MAKQKLNYPTKVEDGGTTVNGQVSAADMNSIKTVVNNNADELDKKLSNEEPVDEDLLPTVEFSDDQFNVNTVGSTKSITIKEEILGGNFSQNLRELRGYQLGEAQMLYKNETDNDEFSWGPIPSGNTPPLGETVLRHGTPTGDSIAFDWDGVVDATSYQLQTSLSSLFTNPTQYTTSNLFKSVIGLASSTTYYARVRAIAGGFLAGPWATVSATTDVPGNITPEPPTITANDNTNTLSASSPLGNSEILQSTLDAAFVPYAGTISIGNVARPEGYIKFKIKAATGRNESSVVPSPAFTEASLPTPATPTPGNPFVDDDLNRLNFVKVSGYPNNSDYEGTLNSGATQATLGLPYVSVGDVSKDIGQVGVRVKGVNNVRNPSAWLFNNAAFNELDPDTSVPVTTFSTLENAEVVPGGSGNTVRNTADFGVMVAKAMLPAGTPGYVQMDVTLGLTSGYLILSTGSSGNSGGQPNPGLRVNLNYNSGQAASTIQGGGNVGAGNTFRDSPNLTQITKVRLISNGSYITRQYFTDAWYELAGPSNADRWPHTVDVYLKGWMEYIVEGVPKTMQNIKQSGLTILP